MNKRWFCTACGTRCPTTTDGRPQWARHVYGLFSEARCSEHCARQPVVDTDAMAQLARMGDLVVLAKLAGLW